MRTICSPRLVAASRRNPSGSPTPLSSTITVSPAGARCDSVTLEGSRGRGARRVSQPMLQRVLQQLRQHQRAGVADRCREQPRLVLRRPAGGPRLGDDSPPSRPPSAMSSKSPVTSGVPAECLVDDRDRPDRADRLLQRLLVWPVQPTGLEPQQRAIVWRSFFTRWWIARTCCTLVISPRRGGAVERRGPGSARGAQAEMTQRDGSDLDN